MKSSVPTLAALSAEVFAVGAATVYLATTNWFGAGDLLAMVVWSLPLALLVFFFFRAAVGPMTAASTGLRYVVLPLVGALLGISWTLIAALILGGWITAFSFPVAFCWLFAGLLAGVVTAWRVSSQSSFTAGVFTASIFVALAGAFAYTHAPDPTLKVVLASGLRSSDVDRFWREVIGRPGGGATDHSLLEGISGAGIADYENGSPVILVRLRKGIGGDRRDTILSAIKASPLVRSVSIAAPENSN